MSKPKYSATKMNVTVTSPKGFSITSPKGSLIAEINNLRKELKDYKQSRKEGDRSAVKETNGSVFVGGMRSPQERGVSSTLNMNKTSKDRFFRAQREDGLHLSPTKDTQHHNKPSTPKASQHARRSKSPHTFTKPQKSSQLQQSQSSLFTNSKSSKNRHTNYYNSTQQEVQLSEIMVKQKDRKLKMDIELNKLRKIITKQLGPVEIAGQVNYLIQLINMVLKDYSNRIVALEKNQRVDESDQSLLIKRQQHQIQQLTLKLQSYEQQIKHLQFQLQSNKQSTQQRNQLAKRTTRNLTAFQSKTTELQQSLKTLTQNSMQLQEQNKILTGKLLKKQQQLLMLDEDINYLRLETEQHKQQKAELNQIYQQTLNEYRDYKRSKTIEFEKLLSQKQKWEKQCKLRRSQNQAISALDQQKLALMKELTEMRMLVNLKSTELEEKKTLMHQNQKRVIYLESELYKLKAELQTIKNQKEFAEFQNQKLREEVEDVKKYANRSYKKDTVGSGNSGTALNNNNNKPQQKSLLTPKHALQQPYESQAYQSPTFSPHPNQEMKQHYNKKLKDKEQKLKALDDIHSLIKKHRNEMQI